MKQKNRIPQDRRRGKFSNKENIRIKVIKPIRLTDVQFEDINKKLNKYLVPFSSLFSFHSSGLSDSRSLFLLKWSIKPTIPRTLKGILNRMGKGKGKIVGSYTRLPKFKIIATIIPPFTYLDWEKKGKFILIKKLKSLFINYPFLSFF